LAAGVTEVKLKPQAIVELTGAMEQLSATAELKPFKEVTVIVEVVEFPAVVIPDAGVALNEKSLTDKLYTVVLFCPSDDPVTVKV
jgi:hypothetical protein